MCYCLSIHSSSWWTTWVVSNFWLLWIVLLWTMNAFDATILLVGTDPTNMPTQKNRKLCKCSHWGTSYIKSACLQRLLNSPHKEQGSSWRTDASKDKGIFMKTAHAGYSVEYPIICVCIYTYMCMYIYIYIYIAHQASVLGILQARIVEWVAIPFSRESSWPRDQTQVSCIAGRFFTIWATIELQFFYPFIHWWHTFFPCLGYCK